MKALIIDDDFMSRLALRNVLMAYSEAHIAVNGREAVEAFTGALRLGNPYDVICLDIMMPEMDGQDVLRSNRCIEPEHDIPGNAGARIIMTTALADGKNIMHAFNSRCAAYPVKPIDTLQLVKQLKDLGLLQGR
jgi:two-component system, chemotaxis family, chemotaxis protein CheY